MINNDHNDDRQSMYSTVVIYTPQYSLDLDNLLLLELFPLAGGGFDILIGGLSPVLLCCIFDSSCVSGS